MTMIRSQTTNRSCSRCVMRMTLTPVALTCRMRSSTASTSATASAAVGSSMMRTSGSNDTARPIAMLWRWPPDRFSTLSRVLGDADAEMRQHLRGVRVHLALVHERHAKHAPERLAAEQEVAGDVDRVAERQVLIDHLDPLTARVGGRGETDFAAVEKNAAGIGNDGAGQDLAQRRLSRAVVADEAKHLARSQDEVDAIERLDGAEGLLMSSICTRIGASALNIRLSSAFVQRAERDSGTPAKRPASRRFSDAAYLNRLRNLSTLSLVTMVTGMSMLGSTFSPFLILRMVSTPATPSWKGSC